MGREPRGQKHVRLPPRACDARRRRNPRGVPHRARRRGQVDHQVDPPDPRVAQRTLLGRTLEERHPGHAEPGRKGLLAVRARAIRLRRRRRAARRHRRDPRCLRGRSAHLPGLRRRRGRGDAHCRAAHPRRHPAAGSRRHRSRLRPWLLASEAHPEHPDQPYLPRPHRPRRHRGRARCPRGRGRRGDVRARPSQARPPRPQPQGRAGQRGEPTPHGRTRPAHPVAALRDVRRLRPRVAGRAAIQADLPVLLRHAAGEPRRVHRRLDPRGEARQAGDGRGRAARALRGERRAVRRRDADQPPGRPDRWRRRRARPPHRHDCRPRQAHPGDRSPGDRRCARPGRRRRHERPPSRAARPRQAPARRASREARRARRGRDRRRGLPRRRPRSLDRSAAGGAPFGPRPAAPPDHPLTRRREDHLRLLSP